jgi:hypothetical protein
MCVCVCVCVCAYKYVCVCVHTRHDDNRSPPPIFFLAAEQEEYNRRKLCTNGYSKEAREIAGKVCGCGGCGRGCELCVWLVPGARWCVVGSFFVFYFFGANVLASYHNMYVCMDGDE